MAKMDRPAGWGGLCVVFAAMAMGFSGCTLLTGRAETEGAGAVLGPRGEFAPIAPAQASNPALLQNFTNYQLGLIVDGFGGGVPREFFDSLPYKLEKQIEKDKLPCDRSGRTLVIRGTVLHYEEASFKQHLMTPVEEVVVRVEFVDGQTGRIVAVVNCVGRSLDTYNSGPAGKAEGLAKAIVRWIKANSPGRGGLALDM